MITRSGVIAALFLVAAAPVPAQSLASRVGEVGTGTVRMRYAARDGICGNGTNIRMDRNRNGEWTSDCEPGPIRVALEVESGTVTEVRTYVGGRWRDGNATELGTVSAPLAAQYFFDLALRGTVIKGDLISAAVMADSTVTTEPLLRIARSQGVTKKVRKQAVFWLSQSAGEAATRGLVELVGDEAEDRDVREQAVFALSQLDHASGVPALVKVARTDKDPAIRKRAIFWLGQSEDPRAVELFEELLGTPRNPGGR